MSPRTRKNEIGFHSRFRVPNSEQILKALKTNYKKKNDSKYDKTFEKIIKYFSSLPKPNNNLDWLAQFNEPGQDCSGFLRTSPISAKNYLGKKYFIYYVQLGDFNQTNLKFSDLIEYSQCFFNEKSIKLLPLKIDIKLEKKTNKRGDGYQLKAYCGSAVKNLKFRHNIETNKFQILAQSVHKILYELKPNDASSFIAFTEHDLYAEESDLFVAGLCDGDYRVGVFSCIRYDPRIKYSEENWFDYKLTETKTKAKNHYSTLLTRSCKLLTHETCHLLGMEHCIYMDCSMNGSGHLKEDFKQSMFLCPIDLKKLWLILDFDLKERYERMKKFFDKHNVCKESKWVQSLLDNDELFI